MRAGANAVGFVFAPSPRRVAPSRAREIARHLHPSVTSIGVFVDAALESILGIVRQVGLGGVQLQGGEPPTMIRSLKQASPGLLVTRAFRVVHADGLAAALDSPADVVMLDPKDPADPVARNAPIPVEWLAGFPPERLIVAGGLTPDNVGAVVSTLHPWGVDVSGGVESSPGHKDPRLVSSFVHAVRRAEHG